MYARGPQPLKKLGKLIRVIDRYPLAPQRYLLIVEIAGKAYLLGITEQNVSLLTPLELDLLTKDVALNQPTDMGFAPLASYLSALSRRWKKDKEPPNG